jgi:hypothetical protein
MATLMCRLGYRTVDEADQEIGTAVSMGGAAVKVC